jgi:hypothetical protein
MPEASLGLGVKSLEIPKNKLFCGILINKTKRITDTKLPFIRLVLTYFAKSLFNCFRNVKARRANQQLAQSYLCSAHQKFVVGHDTIFR